MGAFETINIQDIEQCPYQDTYSGLTTRLYYAPSSFFFLTPFPEVNKDFDSEIIVSGEILMRSGKQLRYIDILIDENELKVTPSGNIKRKKLKTAIDFYILGFKPSVLGFLERCRNEALILFIRDANGNNWQIGHLRNRAFIDNFEAGTGKKHEDNSGVLVTCVCNSPIFIYQKSIDHFAKPGDFNLDFNNDFYIKDND